MKYSKDPFVRNLGVMFSGNGLAVVIPFLLAPLITRIYTPSDFASFELFVKLLTLVTVISSLRFELAIVIPRSEEESKGLVHLCFRLLFFVSLASVLVIPFSHDMAVLLKNAGLKDLMWLFPIGILILGAYSIVLQILIRLEKFKLMAGNKILSSGLNHSSKYAFGLFSPLPIGLVSGHLLGGFIPLLAIFRSAGVRSWVGDTLKSRPVKHLTSKYKDFPLYNGIHAFYDEAYRTLLIMLISIGYGEIVLGLFAFAFRYLRIPVQTLGSSFSQVIIPRLLKLREAQKSVRPLLIRSFLFFFGIGLLPFALLFLFGSDLFAFVFGSKWSEAGKYASIMAPWLLLNFAVSPLSMLPTLVRAQKAFFAINVVFGLLILAAVYLGYSMEYEFETILILMMAGNVLLNLFLFIWFLAIGDKNYTNAQ